MNKSDDQFTATLASALVNTSVRMVRWLKAADPAPKLTGAQASALAVIVWSGGIRPSDLAQAEEIKRPTAARVIGELVTKGFVIRDDTASDGRSVILRATPSGREILAEGQTRRCRPLALALTNLSAGDRAELVAAVSTLDEILNQSLGAGLQAPIERPDP